MVTSNDELSHLKAEVERLNKALKQSEQSRTESEERALAAAVGQGVPFIQNTVNEVPTGQKVKVRKAKNPWVKKADQLEFEEVDMPTFFYKVDLPPSGGVCVKLDGVDYYHGETYTVHLDMLRTLKDSVYKAWVHEQTIRGNVNENVFRRPTARTLRGTGARA